MGVVDAALVDTQRAFDGVAHEYHRSNADNPTLSAMRARVHAVVERHVPRGAHVLDLGCGPGTDGEHFVSRGYRVMAIDWSPAMVAEAHRRLRDAELSGRADVRHLGIHELDRLAPMVFDAAYSNFGPLNCVPDVESAARLIASRVRPGGALVASVIGRVCPWELAVHAARGRIARARVRFARRPVPVPLEGRTVWTRYFTPTEFVRAFAPAGFVRVSLRAMGVFVPPPYMQAFADRHPTLVGGLQRIEDLTADWPGIRLCGDHFLIVLRRVQG